ncbi:8495_t:CDS:2, partial [Cetraspora pellucida]
LRRSDKDLCLEPKGMLNITLSSNWTLITTKQDPYTATAAVGSDVAYQSIKPSAEH